MKRLMRHWMIVILAVVMMCNMVPVCRAAEMQEGWEKNVIIKSKTNSHENVYSATVSKWNSGNIQAGNYFFKFSNNQLLSSTYLKVHHITEDTEGYDWFVNSMNGLGDKVAPFDIYGVNDEKRTEFSKSLQVVVELPDKYKDPALYFLDPDGNAASLELKGRGDKYEFTVTCSGYYVFVDKADLSGNEEPVIYYTVKASAGKGGFISPKGKLVAASGTDITFDIIAENGYRIANVMVNGISVGTARRYTLKNIQADYSIEARFEEIEPTGIKLNESKIRMKKGTKYKWLKATVFPSNALNKKIIWTSSNRKIASVDAKGVIKALKEGTAVITASTVNGKKASVKVTVVKKDIQASRISLNAKKVILKRGKKLVLKATILPVNTGNKKVTWTSSNKKIAVVNAKGVVTAKKPGKVKITCRNKKGKKAICMVTVKK